MIQNGLVVVNGEIQLNPATRVTSDDFVKVNGKRVQSLQSETILFHKPKGLVCSKNDELQRDTIYALIPPKFQHLNHVGRLDKESEGLLVLTNDGHLAQSLTHPSKTIEKEYIVTTDSSFENHVLTKFLKGIYTPEGKARAKSVKRLSPRRVRIILETGMKRQIRIMFQAMNIRVTKLVRVRIGSLLGNGIEPGKIEILEQERIDQLFENPKSDPRATTLESQAIRNTGKRQPGKKWSRPTTRSHDGKRASDRRPRNTTSDRDDSQRDSGTEDKQYNRKFAGKRAAQREANGRRTPDRRKSSPRNSNTSSGPSRSSGDSGRPSGGPGRRPFPKRNTSSRRPR